MSQTSNNMNKNIGFIGAGNMAKALVSGIIKSNLFDPTQIYVSHPSASHLKTLEHLNIRNEINDNELVLDKCDIIIFCVKPQILDYVVSKLKHLFDEKRHLFISICAGITLNKLVSMFGNQSNYRITRCTLNTACLVSESCSAYSHTDNLTADDSTIINRIFSSVGKCFGNVKESDIDAIMAISASGIAYMYMLCDAIADGGVKMGLNKKVARNMVAQTMLGAAKLIINNENKHLLELKDDVCSPGGITIYGVHELEKNSFKSSLMSAVEASVKQAKQLNSS